MKLSEHNPVQTALYSDACESVISIEESSCQDASVVPVSAAGQLTEESFESREVICGKHLQEARAKKGWTVRQLAAKAKISYAELSRIEHGKPATPSTLRKLSPYLTIPIDALLEDAGYCFQTDSDSPVYLDLEGNEISLTDKALKVYERDVELFFQLDTWIENCSDQEIELIAQFLSILNRKRDLDQETSPHEETLFQKVFSGLRSLIHACSAI